MKTECLPINCLLFSRASDYGLVKVDDRGSIIQFSEKPKGADLKAMVIHKLTQCLHLLSVFLSYGDSTEVIHYQKPKLNYHPQFQQSFLILLRMSVLAQ